MTLAPLPRFLALVLLPLALLPGRPAVADDGADEVVGRTFHIDPARGDSTGNGSRTRPWRTLAGCAASGALRGLAGGDVVLLHDGDHGSVSISGGPAEGSVRVEAAPEARPRLARLVVPAGRGWRFKGLTISPSFLPEGEEVYDGSIVSLGDRGDSADLILEDSFVYTTLDSSRWTAQEWMDAPRGIWLGRHGTGHVARNNHVLNTRFGIVLASEGARCEANIVENFSADGIRVTRDGIVVRQNIVKNAFVSAADGDKNHDDAIQCFLFNRGTGTVRGVTLEDNIIIDRENERQPLATSMQAIGFFDGPLIDFVVTGNVVLVAHWHGVSLYDAQNCRIERNVCFSRWNDERAKPWVQLGQKKNEAHGNTVRNNYAHSFDLKADPGVDASGNRSVNARIFQKSLRERARAIAREHGVRHPVSGQPRLR